MDGQARSCKLLQDLAGGEGLLGIISQEGARNAAEVPSAQMLMPTSNRSRTQAWYLHLRQQMTLPSMCASASSSTSSTLRMSSAPSGSSRPAGMPTDLFVFHACQSALMWRTSTRVPERAQHLLLLFCNTASVSCRALQAMVVTVTGKTQRVVKQLSRRMPQAHSQFCCSSSGSNRAMSSHRTMQMAGAGAEGMAQHRDEVRYTQRSLRSNCANPYMLFAALSPCCAALNCHLCLQGSTLHTEEREFCSITCGPLR